MTISSTTRLATFTGNGSASNFPFSFKVFEAADLSVLKLTVATGAIATLALTTDYTVSLNTDQDGIPGGSITLTAGNLATGYTLVVTTAIAALQGLNLANGGAFYPDVMNSALDLLTVLVQQLAQQVGMAVQAPLTDAGARMTLPPAAERAGKLLAFDSNGNASLLSVTSGSGVFSSVALAPALGGNFVVAHGLGAAPSRVFFQMTSSGQFWQYQAADATNLYLTASDGGITGTAVCYV